MIGISASRSADIFTLASRLVMRATQQGDAHRSAGMTNSSWPSKAVSDGYRWMRADPPPARLRT